MLLRITDACDEQCTHCMVSGTPDGKHMSMETLDQVIDFLSRVKPKTMSISGGEPTLHPEWPSIVEKVLPLVPIISVLSNGSFVSKSGQNDLVKGLIKRGVSFQIRTHPTYYPNYKDTVLHAPLFKELGCDFYEDGISQLVRSGRAKGAHPDMPNSPCPCANTVLVAKQTKYDNWLPVMEQSGQFCKPMISPDGKIYPGETSECVSIGCVTDSLRDLHLSACSLRPRNCNKCSGWDALANKYPGATEYLAR